MSGTETGTIGEIIVGTLEAADVAVEAVGPGTWMTVLAGEWKRTLPVMLRVEDRTLHVEALICGALDEGHEEVYRYLLQRNQKALPVHFALDDDGDVILTGRVPLESLDPGTFDRLLGAVLSTADEVFNAVLRRGFATYIEAEQRWRAANDLDPNPVSEAP